MTKYRVYGNTYCKGYELVSDKPNTIEEAREVVDNMDATIYASYLIIKRTKLPNQRPQDEAVDRGNLDRPKQFIKRRK